MLSKSNKIDPRKFAPQLHVGDYGFWYAGMQSPISYPASAHQQCLQIEESSLWFRHRNKCILAVISASPPDQGIIFDIGAGNGYVSTVLQGSGYSVVVVEPSEAGALNARDRGCDPIICTTLQDAGFTKKTLPAIGLFDVLEHIDDDLGFLKYLHSLLTTGGKIYLSVPAYSILWSYEDEYAGHFRRYTRMSLRNKLQIAGFRIIYDTYFFALLPLPIFLLRTIPGLFGFKSVSEYDPHWSGKRYSQGGKMERFARLFDFELNIIRSGYRLPFGGSYLAIACA